MKTWKWYIYILECLDDSYYVGLTWKPELRINQHISGLGGKYSKNHGVKKLVYVEEHSHLETARQREKQIKDWSRVKKRKLIERVWRKDW